MKGASIQMPTVFFTIFPAKQTTQSSDLNGHTIRKNTNKKFSKPCQFISTFGWLDPRLLNKAPFTLWPTSSEPCLAPSLARCLAPIHACLHYPGRKFFIPSMIAGTLAVIGCDSLLFYARISLDKDLSCWRRLLQEKIAEIAECTKLNLSRLTAIDPVEVIILAQWINMY